MKRTLGPKILKKKKIDFEGSEENLQNLIAKILVLKKEYPDLKMTIIENSSELNDSSVEKSDSDCEEHKETNKFLKSEKTEEKGQYCQSDKETLLNIRNWCFFSLEKLSSLHDFRDLLENKQEYDDFKKEVEEDLNNYKIIYGDYIAGEIKELNDYISSL